MKSLKTVLMILLFALIASDCQAGLTVSEMAVTTKVSRGKPIDSVRRISNRSVKALYCFTRTVLDDSAETTIRHLWFRDGQQVKDSVLQVKGKKWRVYSSMPLDQQSVGKWRVEARDSAGEVIKTVEFTVN